MKIVIDARLYGAGKNRGLGRYVEQLVKNLELIDDENEYIVLLRRENWDDYNPMNSRFKKVLADYSWYSFAEQIFLPLKLWRMDCDLAHFPHFNVPLFCPKKFVVTIHDLIMYKFPDERATTRNKWLYKIKYWLHKMVVRQAVKRAEFVITDSAFTKDDIVREFGADESRVKVIYLGFDIEKKEKRKEKEETRNANVLDRYEIHKPYLLYVGSAYPHKNLEILIKAFKLARRERGDLQLVLVGREDYFYEKIKQFNNLTMKQWSNETVFTGQISNGELTKLYRNATAYVFPSLYEGFGLPGLEAMSYGAPVIAARASCLPEIYGEAALYFEAKNENELAGKIGRVLESSGLRESLVKRGYEQIKKYNWRRCAEETLRTYAHLRSNGREV